MNDIPVWADLSALYLDYMDYRQYGNLNGVEFVTGPCDAMRWRLHGIPSIFD